ncbi:MAG: (Fe-S)-binding protein [Actinomycetota bacterium]|nr:(Fe-S)-binding protein [Actinomycetota bacterium]
MKIGLMITCINDALYPKTAIAVVKVLERLGHSVYFPEEQSCCGQMHLNSGYRQEGIELAKRSIEIFSDFDYVVSPSASCVGTVREVYHNAAKATHDEQFEEIALQYSPKVYEFSEFLTDILEVEDVGASFPHKVAYHPTCHSLRVTKAGDRPTRLLRAVRNLQLLEIEKQDSCCGFGGVFALKNSDTSIAMGSDKFTSVKRSGAEVLCSLDNSCLTHIGGISEKMKSGIRVMHLAEILAHTGDQK